MDILIVYASNSGSTFLTAEALAGILSKKHRVIMRSAETIVPNDFLSYDGVILGSPSWAEEGNEGYPLPAMMKLLRAAESADFSQQWFALFGCGDTSYTYFCGAVNVMEEFLPKFKGKKIVQSLKLDSYYYDLKNSTVKVGEWGSLLLKAIAHT